MSADRPRDPLIIIAAFAALALLAVAYLIYSYNLRVMETMMKEGYDQVLLPGSTQRYYQKHGTTNVVRNLEDKP